MRVLLVHNYYGSSAPSGENRVFDAERKLLTDAGHKVEVYLRHSDEIRNGSLWGMVKGALCTVLNPFAALAIWRLCRRFKPDVIHFHNTFPLISPLAVWVASKFAPVVATLHNYRTVCAAAIPMHDGKVCLKCIEQRSARCALRNRCYRGSLLATVPLVISITLWRGVWRKSVSRLICLTPFAKEMMIRAGFPEEKICVKGNSVPDRYEEFQRKSSSESRRVVYSGRLSDEKGPQVLIRAWNRLGALAPELILIGDGDQRQAYEQIATNPQIRFVGQKPHEEVLQIMADSDMLVLPSLCYEGLPTTLLEAQMLGKPCLVSHLGALPTLIQEGFTGRSFRAGDDEELMRLLKQMLEQDDLDTFGRQAQEAYLQHYTPVGNLKKIETIYGELV